MEGLIFGILRYMKGQGFNQLMYLKVLGNFSFQSVKCLKGLKDAFYGYEKVEKTF